MFASIFYVSYILTAVIMLLAANFIKTDPKSRKYIEEKVREEKERGKDVKVPFLTNATLDEIVNATAVTIAILAVIPVINVIALLFALLSKNK